MVSLYYGRDSPSQQCSAQYRLYTIQDKIALTAKITYFGANIDTVCYEEVSHGVTVHVAEGAVPQAVRDLLGETMNWNIRTVGELKSE